MRILHILTYLPAQAEVYATRNQRLLEMQRDLGLEVLGVTWPYFQMPGGKAEEVVNGIRYISTSHLLARLHRFPYFREHFLRRHFSSELRPLVESWKPDVIHAHTPYLNGATGLTVGREAGVPFVYEVRGLWEETAVALGERSRFSPSYLLDRLQEIRVMRSADAVVAICESLRNEILKRGVAPGKVAVVPNGVDTDTFRPRPKNEALLEHHGLAGSRVIGYVGSLRKIEGLSLALKALSQISGRYPDMRMLVVGGGSEQEELEALSSELEIGDRVVFTGPVPHSEVPEYYSLIDLFLYPRLASRVADLVTPIKPLEALSMGRAVLASDVGGMRQLFDHGEGRRFFMAGDVDDLARQALELLGLIEKKGGYFEENRQAMVTGRDWRVLVPSYSELYQRLVSRRGQGQKRRIGG